MKVDAGRMVRRFIAWACWLFLLVGLACYGSFVERPRMVPAVLMFVCAAMALVCVAAEAGMRCQTYTRRKAVRLGQGAYRREF